MNVFELVYIAYLLPVVNLRIARGGKPSSVASRLLQAVVYQSAAIEALGAGIAQYVLAAQLAPCHLYHLAYVGLGLLLRRLFGAFLGLGRIFDYHRFVHRIHLLSLEYVGNTTNTIKIRTLRSMCLTARGLLFHLLRIFTSLYKRAKCG